MEQGVAHMGQAEQSQQQEPKLSGELKDFLDLLAQLQRKYTWCQDEVLRQDRLTQDLLHKLELQPASYRERAKLAEAIRQCRVTRRQCKDEAAIMEPLIQFLGSEKGKTTVSQLQQVLGAVRKTERGIQERCYQPKEMTKEEYEKSLLEGE